METMDIEVDRKWKIKFWHFGCSGVYIIHALVI